MRIISEILDAHADVSRAPRPPQVIVRELRDYDVLIEARYYVLSPTDMRPVNSDVLSQILQRFEQEGVQISYPTEVTLREQANCGSIGFDLATVEVDFLSPNQARLDAQFNNPLEEALKGLNPIAPANFGQAAVIRHCFVQIVADKLPMGEVKAHRFHQLPLGADPFKEHNELQFEEDYGVNRGSPH
jgi:hypothetical protein